MLSTTRRYTSRETTTTRTEIATARSASTRVTVVMSPKSASKRSTSGVIRIPTARAVTNNTPTIDSGNNRVVLSMYQERIAAANRNANDQRQGYMKNRIQ